jgi:hypothetical protein
MSMTILAPIYLALAMTAQAPAGGQNAPDANAERLQFMKDSVRGYQLTLGGDRSAVLKLQETPVFRLGKQYGQDLEDGAIFLWTGENGRPEVAIQVFQIKNADLPGGLWIQEFTSLSPLPVTADRNGRSSWAPKTSGLVFQPVPGAPKPAESAAQRARQMRSLAADFRALDDWWAKGWSELRLLPKPISRYGEPGTKLLDGALFAFVHGTDPEVFLFLEARAGKGGPEWQYALAPMTIFAVKGSYRGKTVWELPNRDSSQDPSKPFFAREYEP